MNKPWYREFYVWLVMSPVIAAIISGTAMIVIASQAGGDSALPGEYGKAGRVIALTPAVTARSQELAEHARGELVAVDPGYELRIELPGLDAPPSLLRATLVHPTLPERDVDVMLRQDGAHWTAFVRTELTAGAWHVYPDDRSWRLVADHGSTNLKFRAVR